MWEFERLTCGQHESSQETQDIRLRREGTARSPFWPVVVNDAGSLVRIGRLPGSREGVVRSTHTFRLSSRAARLAESLGYQVRGAGIVEFVGGDGESRHGWLVEPST